MITCGCGCGEKTEAGSRGRFKKFVGNHQGRMKRNTSPKTAAYLGSKYGRIHVVLAEKALGKPLPKGAQVHHVDENKWNNDPSNLVICENQAYHWLLHIRARTVRAGGNPNTHRVCCYCRQPKPIKRMSGSGPNTCYECHNERRKLSKAAASAA